MAITEAEQITDLVEGRADGANVTFGEWNTPVCPECYAKRDEANPVLSVTWMLSGSGFFTDAVTGEKLRPVEGYFMVDRCFVCDWSQVKREAK